MNYINIVGDFVSYHLSKYPSSVMINLTYKCNSRCIMCNIWKRKLESELTINDWSNVFNDKLFSKIKDVTLSGGEVFLIDNLDEHVSLLLKKFPKLSKVTINTNGLLGNKLYDKIVNILKILSEKNVKLVLSISLDGLGDKHDLIRGVSGNFLKVDSLVDKLKIHINKNKFEIYISSVMMKKNIDDVWNVREWASKKGIIHNFIIIGFSDVFIDNKRSENDLNFDKLSVNKLEHILKKLMIPKSITDFMSYYWTDVYNMYFKNGNRTTPCMALKKDFVIDANANIYYCLSTGPIGNFKNNFDLSKIYFDKNNLSNRKKMKNTICKKCNSTCDVYKATAYDVKKYLWFRLTGKIWKNF